MASLCQPAWGGKGECGWCMTWQKQRWKGSFLVSNIFRNTFYWVHGFPQTFWQRHALPVANSQWLAVNFSKCKVVTFIYCSWTSQLVNVYAFGFTLVNFACIAMIECERVKYTNFTLTSNYVTVRCNKLGANKHATHLMWTDLAQVLWAKW